MRPDLVPIRGDTGVSLYVHFPFCSVKCGYCDFYSETGRPASLMGRVLDEILGQTSFFLDNLGNPPVKTVYFGGGTPNIVPIDLLAGFLEAFPVLAPDRVVEWTIEVNPEALTSGQLRLFASRGINRLSMGVQSFDEDVLRILGRHASTENVYRALELIGSSWHGQLNLDLITAVPGQSRERAFDDLKRVVSFRPDHISMYSLTVEEGTPLERKIRRGELREYPHTEGERLWFDSADYLEDAGYRHYEISNFARPGREGKHNLRYWNMLPYAGCGPSAASTLPGAGGVLRIENPRNLPGYLKGGVTYWDASVTRLSGKDLCVEFLMMGLRLSDGLPVSRFSAVFGGAPEQILPRTVRNWEGRGMLEFTNGFMRLSGPGRYLQDAFVVEALSELDSAASFPEELEWP